MQILISPWNLETNSFQIALVWEVFFRSMG